MLINGILRLGYEATSSFRGHIYVPLIPDNLPVFDNIRVKFETDLRAGMGDEMAKVHEEYNDGQLCQFEITTAGVALF